MVPDQPAKLLDAALARMSFVVEPERYVLIGFEGAPQPADLLALDAPPAQLVRETDETTLLVRASHASAILARHPGAKREHDLCWIRFEAPMSWDVVGFLARISGELAAAGVPIGAVCGFSRDHLFVAHKYLPQTRAVLTRLFPERNASSS